MLKPGDRVVLRADVADELGVETNGLIVAGDPFVLESGRSAVWFRPDDGAANESYAVDAEVGVELVREES